MINVDNNNLIVDKAITTVINLIIRIRFLEMIEKINYCIYLYIVLMKNELNLRYCTLIFIFFHFIHIQNNMAANKYFIIL